MTSSSKRVPFSHRAPGLAVLSKYGSEHFSELGSRSTSSSVYGDTPFHRSQRMSDLARKRAMAPAAWARLMRKREREHGLAAGTLH